MCIRDSVKTTPDKIPADVTIDITNLDQNMGIMASELNLGEGVKVVLAVS